MDNPNNMTALGWIFMIVSWGSIIRVSSFCIWKILAVKKKGKQS
jgi:hypothetical protein